MTTQIICPVDGLPLALHPPGVEPCPDYRQARQHLAHRLPGEEERSALELAALRRARAEGHGTDFLARVRRRTDRRAQPVEAMRDAVGESRAHLRRHGLHGEVSDVVLDRLERAAVRDRWIERLGVAS